MTCTQPGCGGTITDGYCDICGMAAAPAAPAATAGTTPQPVVLISGISGSGKSVAINALEDAGYFCVDNTRCWSTTAWCAR